MNLKNSKFFKRIQQLRRVSKEKMRRQRERLLNYEIERAFNESNGSDYEREKLAQAQCVLDESPECEDVDESSSSELDSDCGEETSGNAEVKAAPSGKCGGKVSAKSSPRKKDNNEENQNKVNGGLIKLNNQCYEINYNPYFLTKNEEEPNIRNIKCSICSSNSRYPMIAKIAKAMGFRVVKESKLWNILWTDNFPCVEICKNMKRFQQTNHFPGMMEVCRKDLLSRNLNRMLKLYPRDYKIFPKTWIFPADYGEAMTYSQHWVRRKAKQKHFILKPDAGAQGRGIWLTNDLKNINPHERMICQTYINRPLLIDGFKFDLRVYTLITSVDPLRIFVFNEGLARFATNKYTEPSTENSTDLFMHLTNYSVNKRSSQYEICDDDDCGSKRKLSAINNWMRSRNYDVQTFWNKIDDIIIKVMLSAWPMLKHNYHACFPAHDKIQACFEILGFDILVDSKLRPYVLEVNHSPSFHMGEQVDREVKKALIHDTLALVCSPLADKKQIMREDRKRVKQRLLKQHREDPKTNSSQTKRPLTLDTKKSPTSSKDHSSADSPTRSVIGDSALPDTKNQLSPLAQQIAWEESHLGNFRRIMPPHNPELLNYYCQFYTQQNTASIYAKTAVSKKREDLAKKFRIELEAKRHRQQEMYTSQGIRFEDRQRKRANVPRAVIERRRVHMYKNMENWTPGFISDAEERLRNSWQQMRSDLCRNKKIVEMIYECMYKAGSLTSTDIVNYPQLYRSLQNGGEISGF